MNWQKMSNHHLKYESVCHLPDTRVSQQLSNASTSFIIPHQFEPLEQQSRCWSVHCDYFGTKSEKQKMFHDLQSEVAEHKRQRLAQVILQNLKKNQFSQQNSARNIAFKQNGSPQNYSSFMKKVKDYKQHESTITNESKFGMGRGDKKFSSRQPSIQVDQIQETKETINFTCSPSPSPRYQSLQKKNNQFLIKQFVHKSNALEKLLAESKFHIKTSLSPRSVVSTQHKKTKSTGLSAYSDDTSTKVRKE